MFWGPLVEQYLMTRYCMFRLIKWFVPLSWIRKLRACLCLTGRSWTALTLAGCDHYALWRVFATGRGEGANVGYEAGMCASTLNLLALLYLLGPHCLWWKSAD